MSPFLRTFLAVYAVIGCVGFPVIVYLVGFYCGANWAKRTIERGANVKIDFPSIVRITPNQSPHPEKENTP